MRFRIFTNDRGRVKGVAMYSCLKEVEASSRDAAFDQVPFEFDRAPLAPAVAIKWPPQTPIEKAWLRKHT